MPSLSDLNWTGLTASIGAWMHRADYTSIAPDLITMAEQDFNDELRVPEMEAETSITGSSTSIAHPTDWLEWKNVSVTVEGYSYPVRPVTLEIAQEKTYRDTQNAPRYLSVVGSKTYIYPQNGSSYTFPTVYYAEIPGLTASKTTNAILSRYPSLYLYGALSHAKAFLDEVTWQFFEGKRKDLVERIKVSGARAEWGSQVIEMKPDILTP